MKYLIFTFLLLFSMTACKKHNIEGDSSANLTGMEILKSHSWRWEAQLHVTYNTQKNDTIDYLASADSCAKISRYSVGDTTPIFAGAYNWMSFDPCSGKTEISSVFSIENTPSVSYVLWGYYTIIFVLDELNDNTFCFYKTFVGQMGDSTRIYYKFVKY